MADIEGEAKVVEDDGRGDSLNAIHAQVEGGAGPEAAPGVSGGGAMDALKEARDLINFCVVTLKPLYPSIGPIYTPETIESIAGVLVPLMEKYGLTFGGFFDRWGPEINAIIVLVPIIGATFKAIKADNAARAEAVKAGYAGENK